MTVVGFILIVFTGGVPEAAPIVYPTYQACKADMDYNNKKTKPYKINGQHIFHYGCIHASKLEDFFNGQD